VISTVYDQASRKLTITFNEKINIATFTTATLGNLSIQDGTTTIILSGASIITAASSIVMEATLTVAEDSALYVIRTNALRLVVAAPVIVGLDSFEVSRQHVLIEDLELKHSMNEAEEDLDRAIRAIEAVRPTLNVYVEAWPEARRFFAILRGDDD